MKSILTVIPFLAVIAAGCTGVDPATAEAQDRAYCYNIGAKGGKVADCLMYRDSVRRSTHDRQSAALMNFGNSIIQAQQQQQMINAMNRPRMTNCQPFGNSIQCTTF